jgi:hypothetical protein
MELANPLFTPQLAILNYAIFFMFLRQQKIFYPFIVLPWTTMFSLKFTLGFFSLRIGTQGTLFLTEGIMIVYTLYQHLIHQICLWSQ